MQKNSKRDEVDGYKLALAIRQLEENGIIWEHIDNHISDIDKALQMHGIFFKWTAVEKALLVKILREFRAREEIQNAIKAVQNGGITNVISTPTVPKPCQRLMELQDKIALYDLDRDSAVIGIVSEHSFL